MSTALVRMRFAAMAVKVETTIGTDVIAGSPGASDWISGDWEVDLNPVVIGNPELTGSLDSAAGVIGGLRPRLRVRVPLRGSGTPETPPDFGTLLKCCGMAETITSSTIGAPTAATAGSTTSITLASPFGTTANAYRGMPLNITGTSVETAMITAYTTGRVASLGHTLSVAASSSSNAQIPKNVLYSPTSDESVSKTATLYGYADGLLWTFTGAQGNFSLEVGTGGFGMLSFDLLADYGAHSATALPSGAAAAATAKQVPPRWVGGKSQLNRSKVQVRSLRFDAGLGIVLPDDPEAAQGYGPAVAISRASAGSIDPLMNTSSSTTLFTAFQNGTAMPLVAQIGASAGNSFGITIPTAKMQNMRPGSRDGLGQYDIPFSAEGPDAGFFLACF